MPIGEGLPEVGLVPKTFTVMFVASVEVPKSNLNPVKVVAEGAVTGITVRSEFADMP